MKEIKIFTDILIRNIERVIIGKREVIELAVISLLSRGHLLIDDVPGVGKTMLARSLAQSIGCRFGRIQFTPDAWANPIRDRASGRNQSSHTQDTIRITGSHARKSGNSRRSDSSLTEVVYGTGDTKSNRI
jgi:DNA polymerase III delta prime subunit